MSTESGSARWPATLRAAGSVGASQGLPGGEAARGARVPLHRMAVAVAPEAVDGRHRPRHRRPSRSRRPGRRTPARAGSAGGRPRRAARRPPSRVASRGEVVVGEHPGDPLDRGRLGDHLAQAARRATARAGTRTRTRGRGARDRARARGSAGRPRRPGSRRRPPRAGPRARVAISGSLRECTGSSAAHSLGHRQRRRAGRRGSSRSSRSFIARSIASRRKPSTPRSRQNRDHLGDRRVHLGIAPVEVGLLGVERVQVPAPAGGSRLHAGPPNDGAPVVRRPVAVGPHVAVGVLAKPGVLDRGVRGDQVEQHSMPRACAGGDQLVEVA